MAKRRPTLTPQEQTLVEQRYGSLRGFTHAHHVAAYEDKLQAGAAKLPLEDRLTCSSCKATADPEHIVAHAGNPTTPSVQKVRAAVKRNRNLNDSQFTLNYDQEG